MTDPKIDFPHVAAVLTMAREGAPNAEMFEGFILEAITVYSRQMARIRIPLDTKLTDEKRELIKWRDLAKHVNSKMDILHASLPEHLRGENQEKPG